MPDAPPRARPGMFAHVATVIGERGCSLGAIDLVEATPAVHDGVRVRKTREAGLARKTAMEP